ncbi:carboxypeptidase-like regulatory domain-containing protein [Nakamurella sp. PAMC28650]|uniref:carboxypeptidase-like regulatory domain-containing protein n=1 Tax=Nakamurella sp. PAMC28650 TaxID=2762325 RepID=UPI00164CF23C|nr:carboxypeptidase-like regulatory domain-containing protein [Nakamurella sp. PAMC28650]QNK81317.1 carboxypeptidase regulatory-like domain-containing protein [Nakamurella sp. PAMC28650]
MNEQPPPRAQVGPAAGDASPLVELQPLIRCGAGTSATFEVFVTHRGPVAAHLRVTVLGLDGRWVPPPLPVGPIEPGESTRITLSLVPERGTLGAKYPFVVAAEATPVSGRSAPTMGVAESVLAVDGRDPITMTLSPQTPVAAFGRRIKVQITNPGHFDRELNLTGTAARGAAISLSSAMVTIPAGRTVTIAGRVRVTHPRIIGGQNTHTFAVAARGLGAPEFAEGTLRSKPLLGGRLTGLLIAVVVIALWAGAGIVGIPKLSKYFSNKSAADAAATAPVAPGAANATKSSGAGPSAATSGAGGSGVAPGAGPAGGSGAGGGGAAGPGGAGAGAGGAGGAGAGAGGADASGARLSGTVTGVTPKGVSVSLEPTSLVEAAAAGAGPAAGATDATTASALRAISTGLYKIPGDALRLAPASSDSGIRSTSSAADGTFSFAGITAPGYYLLTLAKAGFATQRFMINASTLSAAAPIKVALVPGDGSMSGKVTSPSGTVGAASVTITDGTVALQTSTASKTGAWTVKGLSTPGTYLVTVSSTGFGASSKLVTLAAGGTGTADLALIPGVAAINGTVSGTDGLGHLGGIGGVTVTATGTSRGVAASRTATTVTSGPVGTYALPDLPVPGQYTVTVSGTGFASQTQQVALTQGSSAATVDISLTRADGTVAGTVSGGGTEGGLIGAGLTLTGANATYKTMTTSVPAGAFRFTGVPPGTYVLQGSQYGRVASSATVVVTAAGTATANLTLIGAPDTELPATSRITGRAVDSRTQGPLTCDRAADPKAVCIVTATVPIPVPGTRTGVTETISAFSGPAENYTLPGIDDKTHGGLVAGLYAVTLSAPGYEPTTVQVQVAQGQVNPAAQVSLPPLGLITGTVTTRVGSTAGPSCVVSVPAGVAVPTRCTPTSATACTAVGSSAARCSLTRANGNYEIRGLVHGGYQVVVVPTDTEYLTTTPLAVQLDLGGDFRYDATLDRLGRATVTVLQPNLQSLALSAAKGAVVGMVDGGGVGRGNPLPGDSTSGDGILTITGLLGSYTAHATGEMPTGLTTGTTTLPGTASVTTGAIGLNQTVAITEVLTAPIGAVVGHVTVSVDGQARDVADAPVQIAGIVGFSGRSSVSGAATVRTDANGCYAIVPVGWSGRYSLVSPDCPTAVGRNSVATMKNSDGSATSLIALPLGVSVAAQGTKTQSYSASGVLIGFDGTVSVIPPIALLAQPSVFPALSLDLKVPSGPTDASGASIVVTRKPAGAGNITVTAGANGSLTWTDSNLGTGRAVPGTYVLQATLAGYSSAGSAGSSGVASGYATLWCDLGTACRFGTQATPAPAWTMSRLPSITGVITAADLPNGVTLDQAIISVVSKPSAAGSISAPVDAATGAVAYRDTSLPAGLAQPSGAGAPYVFTISLAGYQAKTVSIDCGATFTDGCHQERPPGNPSPLSVKLTPLPRFSGAIVLNYAAFLALNPKASANPALVPALSLSDATVSVTSQPNPSNPVIVKINADGTLTWKDPTQPESVVTPYAKYSLTFAKPGYETFSLSLNCSAGPCVLGTTAAPITLNMLPAGGGTVSVNSLLPGKSSVDWSSAQVTVNTSAAGTSGLKVTVVDGGAASHLTGRFVWSDTNLPYPGITQPGSYSLNVSIPGYGSTTAAPAVLCSSGQGCEPAVGALQSFPTGAGAVAVDHLLSDGLPIEWSKATISLSTQPPGSNQLTIGLRSTGDSTADLTWSDPSLPQPDQGSTAPGITRPGTYVLVISLPGYSPVTTAPFTCNAGVLLCQPSAITLLRLPTIAGTVTLTSTIGTTDPPNGVTISISPASTISVKVDPVTGKISWHDPSQPADDLVTAGTYSLTFAKPGYATSLPIQFTCAAGSTTCDVGTVNLLMDPHGTGSVSVGTPPPNGAAVDWSKATLTLLNQAAGSSTLSISLIPDNTTTREHAAFSWADSGLPFPGITQPGSYRIRVSLPGYGSATSDLFNCRAGDLTCGPVPDLVLIQQPTFTGVVTTDPSGGSLVGSAVSVISPAGVNAVNATVAATAADPTNGTITWQEAGGAPAGLVSYGTYQISVSNSSYLPTSVNWTCSDTVCTPPTLLLTKSSTLQVNVVSRASGAAPVNGALFDLSGTLITSSTVSASATSNSVSFPGQSPFGDYTVNVHAAGFANDTFDKATLTTSSCTNGTTTRTGFVVIAGGTTVCTVTVSPLGSITLHTVGTSGADSTVVLGSTAITVVRLGGGQPTGPTFSGTTSATGDLTLTGTTVDDGLVAGNWQVTAAQTGYATAVGTVKIAVINGTYAMAVDTGAANPFDISGGVLQVPLTVKPVDLQVHLEVGTTELLPAVTVAVTGPGTALSCTVKLTGTTYSCTENQANTSVVNLTSKYVDFASVNPGVYTVSVTSPTSSYRTVTLLASIVAGVSPQQLVISLDQRSSTQSGSILLADGTGDVGVTASLRTAQDIGVTANDQNGQPLSVKTKADGTFTFTGIPDGRYTLVGTFPGYAPVTLTQVVEDSSLTTTPPALSQLTLTARATRSVNLTFTSTAAPSSADGPAVNLAGASVTLNPPAGIITGMANGDQPQTVSLPLTAPYTINVPQLPTGTWTATITGQTNAPFDATLTGETIVVPQAAVSASTAPPVAGALAVQQALTSLTVNWSINTCLTAPAVAPGTLALNITNTDTGVATTTPIAAAVTGTKAVAQVYLPQGHYSFLPTVDSTQWTAAATTFTVGDVSAGTANKSSPNTPVVNLAPVQVPVAVSMTVDGSGSGADGLTVTATGGTPNPAPGNLSGGGKASLCLAPAIRWTFKVSSSLTTQKISVPGKNIVVVAAPNSGNTPPDNTVSFTADTVTPVISMQDVTGRVDTTPKDVDVTIKDAGGTPVYTGQAVGVVPSSAAVPGTPGSAGPPVVAPVAAISATPSAPANAPAVILGTCSGCTYTMTATPHVPGVFSAVTDQALDPTDATTFDAKLPYHAAMVTITVKHGAVLTAGATVTVSPSTVTAGPTASNGTTLFQDVPIAAKQTFTADWVDNSLPATPKHYVGSSSPTTLAAGQDAITIVQVLTP